MEIDPNQTKSDVEVKSPSNVETEPTVSEFNLDLNRKDDEEEPNEDKEDDLEGYESDKEDLPGKLLLPYDVISFRIHCFMIQSCILTKSKEGWVMKRHSLQLPFWQHVKTGVITWTKPYIRRATSRVLPLQTMLTNVLLNTDSHTSSHCV